VVARTVRCRGRSRLAVGRRRDLENRARWDPTAGRLWRRRPRSARLQSRHRAAAGRRGRAPPEARTRRWIASGSQRAPRDTIMACERDRRVAGAVDRRDDVLGQRASSAQQFALLQSLTRPYPSSRTRLGVPSRSKRRQPARRARQPPRPRYSPAAQAPPTHPRPPPSGAPWSFGQAARRSPSHRSDRPRRPTRRSSVPA